MTVGAVESRYIEAIMKRLSSLELFILSCFERGLETPYDLQRRVGLSLGATSPALKRLLKGGMLKRATGTTATKRPRHAYSLSAEGKRFARNGWKDYLDDPVPPSDLDSFLRILDMAVYNKAKKATVIAFMLRGVASRSHAADVSAVTGDQRWSGEDRWSYPYLRGRFEQQRLLSEVTTLSQILTQFKKNPPPKMVQQSLH